ncbi:MAG: hypothetical protein KBT63_07740 [Porticoccaceae bacterium]|nr:hypothetical protein [Porticoccaceae bacterium]
MRKAIQLFGKFTGVVAGVGTCACWIIAMWMPASPLAFTGIAFFVALLMLIFSIIAVIASLQGHGITLIVLFVASFFPIGWFLLGSADWVRVIGLLNVGYLIAGLVAWKMPDSRKPKEVKEAKEKSGTEVLENHH